MKHQKKGIFVLIISAFIIIIGISLLVIFKGKDTSESSIDDIKILTDEDLNDPYYYTLNGQEKSQ